MEKLEEWENARHKMPVEDWVANRPGNGCPEIRGLEKALSIRLLHLSYTRHTRHTCKVREASTAQDTAFQKVHQATMQLPLVARVQKRRKKVQHKSPRTKHLPGNCQGGVGPKSLRD